MKRKESIKYPKIELNINMEQQKQRFSLTLLFSAIVFFVLLLAILLAGVVVYLLVQFELIGVFGETLNLIHVILLMTLISLVLGSAITILLGKVPLRPINMLVNAMNSLASGNFKTRLHFKGSLYNHPTFAEITNSFNKLAEELENTEVLRSDFVNNFSHEFKTPIVSIAGFAKLLQKENLNEEQRKQYLCAIEEESVRLSYIATNILNMTKIENQSILTDVTEYNLSEQIRSSVLLLENKWAEKKIELQLDFDEYSIEANEELLKQVWINLLDNAIKFAPRYGMVAVTIRENSSLLEVSVINTGSEIPIEKQEKIFNKFYQAEESHTAEGNGIGLAIVKRVTELHKGNVVVKSENGMTTFTLVLPKKQFVKGR